MSRIKRARRRNKRKMFPSRNRKNSSSSSSELTPSLDDDFNSNFIDRSYQDNDPSDSFSESTAPIIEVQPSYEDLLQQKEGGERCEVTEHAKQREMNSLQEVWNAVTMILPLVYVTYYIISGKWVSADDIASMKDHYVHKVTINSNFYGTDNNISSPVIQEFDYSTETESSGTGCINSSLFPNLHALPPFTITAIAIGIWLHSPCSIYYHLACAFYLPPGKKRMDHWSRRLDQAMMHVGLGTLWCYGASANVNYLLGNMAFGIDSAIRLFEREIRPKRTLYRMIIAFFAPSMPILFRGDVGVFCVLTLIYAISGWLFSVYPLGRWSHGWFHVVVFFANPIMMKVATDLASSQEQIQFAAKCAVLRDVTGSERLFE